jgi:hypothetical protein
VELSDGEKAIIARLDELTARLAGIETAAHPGKSAAATKPQDEPVNSSS